MSTVGLFMGCCLPFQGSVQRSGFCDKFFVVFGWCPKKGVPHKMATGAILMRFSEKRVGSSIWVFVALARFVWRRTVFVSSGVLDFFGVSLLKITFFSRETGW